jgi:penicillin-binding protein 2
MRIYEDLRAVQDRLVVAQRLVLGLMLALLAAFWHLQVLKNRYFLELAESNRIRNVPLVAPRGLLLDRAGNLLVENRASFNILLTPEHAEDLDVTVTRLAEALQLDEAAVRQRLAARPARFRPAVIRADASFADVAALEARRLELPETGVEVVPLRAYPMRSAAAHALGRVGEVSERQLEQEAFAMVAPGTFIGQAGLEARYNAELMGRDGVRRVVVNSRGAEVAEAERTPPVDGPPLTLTLDASLQAVLERAFAGRRGSAAALDPETGEILALGSLPSYDPNAFATGVDSATWRALIGDPMRPLMNRVIQGQYSPGSTFKPIEAMGALAEGVITPQTTIYCPGYLSIYNTVFRCNRPEGHGSIDLRRALAVSCNVFFYQTGVRLEIERIARWSRRFGLGSATGIDLPAEATGLVPSPEWKQRVFRTPWYAGETVSVAIGQGQLNVTPMQMARATAALAVGKLVQPHLVKAIAGRPVEWPAAQDLGFAPEHLEAVRAGMCDVVGPGGTGWRARVPGVEVCGKTGSAQVVNRARLQRDGAENELIRPHGWFIAFAPRERPRIALAVLVENSGSGAEGAAPVAREILAHFFRVAASPAPPAVPATAAAEAP